MAKQNFKFHKNRSSSNSPNYGRNKTPPHDPNLELTEYGIKPVPKFHTSNECLAFIQNFPETAEKLMNYKIVTDYEELTNIILGGIKDIEKSNMQDNELLKSIRDNLPPEYKPILDIIDKKKDIYVPEGSNFKDRLLNTLDYLFYHHRQCIYCRIEDNKVKQFIIFVNKDYVNNWSQYLTFEGENGEIVDMDTYYRIKRKYYRHENIIPEKSRWWAGSFLLDNELGPTLWGQHLITSIVDMLYYTTQTNKLKDKSFFINKRDHPLLRTDLTEAHAFLFPKKTKIPKKYIGKGFLPIHSFFSSEAFADFLTVTTDDWEILSGDVNISEKPIDRYSNINYEKYKNIRWRDKKNVAFFRGSSTQGSSLETNQRLKLAKISYEYNNNSTEPKEGSILNSAIVTYNIRDKKTGPDAPVTFTKREKVGVPLGKFVPMSEQAKYKYILSLSGHSAPARFMYLMKMKVLILKVESLRPETDELWFYPLLKPYEDFIPIKKDLSDLFEKIEWCINHDEECKKIAKNAYKKFRTLLSKTYVLNYHAYCINSF